ncbi:MAG: hypothetical protein AAFZ65_20520 [Planctomycetota bacterium]
MSSSVENAVRTVLVGELLPTLEGLVGDRGDELRDSLQTEVVELGERLASAALRGDTDGLELLEGVPALILDRHRVEVEADALRAQRAIVRAVFKTALAVIQTA